MQYVLQHPIKPGYYYPYKSIDNKLRFSPISYPNKLNILSNFVAKSTN